MDKKEQDKLTILGSPIKGFPESPDKAELETFQNLHSDKNYWITLECPEFTSLCPKTKQPDFGVIAIRYIPDKKCIETKSLKLYLFSFRNVGIFLEDAVNRVLDKVVKASSPKKAIVEGRFRPRGGITISVSSEYKKKTNKGG